MNAIQRKLTDGIVAYTQEKTGLPLDIERINILSPNKIQISNILLNDLNGDTLAAIKKATLHISLLSLLDKEIRINTVTVSRPTIHIKRNTPQSPTNAQFVFDLLSDNDSTASSPLPHLRVNQFHLYDGKFTYDILSEPSNEKQSFDAGHISIDNLSATLSLKALTPDSLNLHIHKISAIEQSGFTIKDAKAELTASHNAYTLKEFRIELPQGHIGLRDTYATYDRNDSIKVAEQIAIRGNIYSNRLTPSDFAAFMPQLSEVPSYIKLNTPFSFGNNRLKIDNATIGYAQKELYLNYSLSAHTNSNSPSFNFSVNEGNITSGGISTLLSLAESLSVPHFVNEADSITLKGNISVSDRKATAALNIGSNLGNIHADIRPSATGGYNGTINGTGINARLLTGNNDLGRADISSNFTITDIDKKAIKGEFSSSLTNFSYKGYLYSPIKIRGKFTENRLHTTASINDKCIDADAALSIDASNSTPKFNLALQVDTIRPHDLLLTEQLANSSISFGLETKFSGLNIDNAVFTTTLKDFILRTPDKYRKISNLSIADNTFGETRNLIINSDIIKGHLTGRYEYSTLPNSFSAILKKHLPSLMEGKEKPLCNNSFVFNLSIRDSEILEELFNIPVSISEMSYISGNCDDASQRISINTELNDITIKKQHYKKITLETEPIGKGMSVTATAYGSRDKKTSSETDIRLSCIAYNDTLSNEIRWYKRKEEQVSDAGKLQFNIAIGREKNGTLRTSAHILDSDILYKSNQWNIAECNINGLGNSFEIDNLMLTNSGHSIEVQGKIGDSSKDSLNINLTGIEVEEVLDLVNFRAVSFGGKATGSISLSGILGAPRFNSTLQVDSFKFEKGYMGNLLLRGNWQEAAKAVYLYGIINDKEYTSTIEGIVSPANDTINLLLLADGTRIDFLNHMIGSIISDVDARGYGDMSIRGKLGDINLYGNIQTIGKLRVTSTNTSYNLHGEDTLSFTRNRIGFNNFKIYDHRNNMGVLNGSVDHKSLKNFTCKFDINADRLLAYDTHSFNDDGFYGTAYITGDAQLTSNQKGLFLNVDAVAENGSRFIYNSAGPLGAASNKFVTFVDREAKSSKTQESSLPSKKQSQKESTLRLEFKINVTPETQLRVYTNTVTEDYIDIHSSGTINVIHDEKEEFRMAGNLEIDRGTYKFTLQNIFPKEFAIRSGSIKFNGKPFDAALNLHTAYTIPSVPLTDLDLTAGRRNSVKVDCLMDIAGTLQKPELNFGIELPDGNESEKELLASSISTPEQTNMQFMYLVAIGKFYTYDYNNMNGDSRSSTMMESLISSTFSGQLNNMLSQITENENWNFSGNFTTSEKGWNSMEVEGILTGRLLNNRLLINGNLGYRDNPYTNRNFIGDIDIQFILDKKGIFSLKGYSKTNDRYFSRTDLTTQGAGIMLRHEFNTLFNWRKKKKNTETKPKD